MSNTEPGYVDEHSVCKAALGRGQGQVIPAGQEALSSLTGGFSNVRWWKGLWVPQSQLCTVDTPWTQLGHTQGN